MCGVRYRGGGRGEGGVGGGGEGVHASVILKAIPAGAIAHGRLILAGQVSGDGPDKNSAGPPGWVDPSL